jgi:hypothetical protein
MLFIAPLHSEIIGVKKIGIARRLTIFARLSRTLRGARIYFVCDKVQRKKVFD